MSTRCLIALPLVIVSCTVMKPVPPPAGLGPVKIGGGSGSAGAVVDVGLPPDVELRWDGRGSLLVSPTVNGADVGSFVLDTGATGMVVTSGTARRAGLQRVGTTQLQTGAVTTVFESSSFRLGPLELTGTRYAGADFPHGAAVFGEQAGGICGYDLFAGAVVELDAAGRTMGIHDPADYVLPEGRWYELEVRSGIPLVECRFEGDRAGRFMLDTGYGGSVILFGSDLAGELLSDRASDSGRVVYFGGSYPTRTATIGWLQIAGRRVEPVSQAHFATGPGPAIPDVPALTGIIGMGLLSRFVLVLDYGNGRMAVLERPED